MEEVTVKAVNDATITQGRILEIEVPNSFLAQKFQPANRGELDAARREILEKSKLASTNLRDLRDRGEDIDDRRVVTINQEERNKKATNQNVVSPKRNENGAGRLTLPKHDSLLAAVQGSLALGASQEAA
jgi:hypothetical protein